MNKTFAVIRREFTARVRTKAFVISTVLFPFFIVLMVVLPGLLMSASDHTARVAIVDAGTSGLGNSVASDLRAQKLGHGGHRYRVQVFTVPPAAMAQKRDALIARTGFSRDKHPDGWDGVLVLPADALASGKVAYYGSDVGSLKSMQGLRSSVSSVLTTLRLNREGVDTALVQRAVERAHLDTIKVSDGVQTGQSGAASFIVAYAMGFLLYFAILLYGQQTMSSVIEEKSSRIMEVLTSSLTPFEMLLGKVLGVGLAGLTQMTIWIGTVFVVGSLRMQLGAMFGVGAQAMLSVPIPSVSGSLMAVFLIYFALGFLLYGALYAAIGSMCNTIQETQQYASFVTMLILFGFLAVFSLINDPTGSLGVVFSNIPFFAPFTMPVRWSLTSIPIGQLLLSLALMVAALLACVWLAARIYRTGILMYGKKPSWRELLRWIRA